MNNISASESTLYEGGQELQANPVEVSVSVDSFLVIISYALSVLGAYTTFALITAMRYQSSKIMKFIYMNFASIGMSICAIWSMHFIGTIAYRFQSVNKINNEHKDLVVTYDVFLTILSALVANVLCTIGFAVSTSQQFFPSLREKLLGMKCPWNNKESSGIDEKSQHDPNKDCDMSKDDGDVKRDSQHLNDDSNQDEVSVNVIDENVPERNSKEILEDVKEKYGEEQSKKQITNGSLRYSIWIRHLIPSKETWMSLVFGDHHRPHILQVILGAFFCTGGICAMHYIGMAATNIEKTEMRMNAFLVILSIAIAFFASGAAIWISYNLQREFFQVIGGSLAGIAVCGMHYTGMAAAYYEFNPEKNNVQHTGNLSGVDLALATSIVTSMCYFVMLTLSTRTHRMFMKKTIKKVNKETIKLEKSIKKMNLLLIKIHLEELQVRRVMDVIQDGVAVIDRDGKILKSNKPFQKICCDYLQSLKDQSMCALPSSPRSSCEPSPTVPSQRNIAKSKSIASEVGNRKPPIMEKDIKTYIKDLNLDAMFQGKLSEQFERLRGRDYEFENVLCGNIVTRMRCSIDCMGTKRTSSDLFAVIIVLTASQASNTRCESLSSISHDDSSCTEFERHVSTEIEDSPSDSAVVDEKTEGNKNNRIATDTTHIVDQKSADDAHVDKEGGSIRSGNEAMGGDYNGGKTPVKCRNATGGERLLHKRATINNAMQRQRQYEEFEAFIQRLTSSNSPGQARKDPFVSYCEHHNHLQDILFLETVSFYRKCKDFKEQQKLKQQIEKEWLQNPELLKLNLSHERLQNEINKLKNAKVQEAVFDTVEARVKANLLEVYIEYVKTNSSGGNKTTQTTSSSLPLTTVEWI